MANNECILFKSYNFLATRIKCAIISERCLGVEKLRISWTVQKLTWLNRRVNATTFGATRSLFFLFHEQLDSSSGLIALKTLRSRSVNWFARSSGEIPVATSGSDPCSVVLDRPGNEFDLLPNEFLLI